MEAPPFAATQPLTSDKASVLFALSKRERALFFGGGQVDLSAKASCQWIEERPLGAAEWLRALESSEPEVLVTGGRRRHCPPTGWPAIKTRSATSAMSGDRCGK